MRSYVRARTPGGCYFFTVNLAERSGNDLLVRYVDDLRAAFAKVQAARPFVMDAVVILPEHLHCLWTLPEGDADFATRWRLIKSLFSAAIPAGERVSSSRQRRGERGIWQRRYWEHLIRDQCDYNRHVDYIHHNPVKHGHASSPGAWPYSSFGRWVEKGLLEPDWEASEVTRKDELE